MNEYPLKPGMVIEYKSGAYAGQRVKVLSTSEEGYCEISLNDLPKFPINAEQSASWAWLKTQQYIIIVKTGINHLPEWL